MVNAGDVRMKKTIKQTVIFKASPNDVYEALMDSKKHSSFTGGKASISRKVGGIITAYDDYISGKNIELIPDKKIVQKWRAVDWDEGFYSLVTFEFSAVREGTRMVFIHTDLPDGTADEFAQGWIDNYWEPLKKYLDNSQK